MLLRRNRLIVIGAAFMVFMLYRVVQNSWDDTYEQALFSQYRQRPQPAPVAVDHAADQQQSEEPPPEAPKVINQKPEVSHEKSTDGKNEEGTSAKPSSEDKDSEDSTETPTPTETKEAQEELFSPKDATDIIESEEDKDIEVMWMNPPNDESNIAFHHKSDVHWKKPKEHFPVPSESLITLPTGTPKDIPKIQYEFGHESIESQQIREKRLRRVKDEITRSWAGYKKYAWMHDELMPVSAKSKDPFCGWAATLVDSLDTLWIAGLKDEFDEAAKAVGEIDFTWTKRHDIPVFETTIRYLGGLVAGFDVSGGEEGSYKILLDKAVELAEILMGIFDTPNRMPLLYYQWKPDYTSQPHRAGRVGIAELATLSMEFTRLAQLTGEDKYYDAIDRITNGLVEMQEAGTLFPGLFPENIDASGCNRTATTIRDNLSKVAQKQMQTEDVLTEPDSYESGRHPFGEDRKPPKSSVEDNEESRITRRQYDASPEADLESQDSLPDTPGIPTTGFSNRGSPPFAADGSTSNWDCVPQPLIPAGYGHQEFHMGGAQDSAYEYFPKQYLLLGGLESKYQKLHEDAVDGINKYLMYRPMSKDDDEWDVVFPAKVSTNGHPEEDAVAKYEITHLTCFIGGMYGLGGKIFGREQDIETAKKLTDGCVWAYQLMPSGLMPEASRVVPCPGLEKCEFNETLWWDKLDTSKAWRDAEVAKWNSAEAKHDSSKTSKSKTSPISETEEDSINELRTKERTSDDSDEISSPISKRELPLTPGRVERKKGSELPESLRLKLGLPDEDPSESSKETKETKEKEAEDDEGSSTSSKANKGPPPMEGPPRVPHTNAPSRTFHPAEKPLNHEEYVKKKIEDYSLPSGFVDILAPNYILRPEAIESVWYMYRITGDPEWMDKGWRMFEATIRATRTQFANSAVADVTKTVPLLLDSMESFWLAETLKYYFLLFSEPDVISLDEWVLNTEAHPFKRPLP